MLYFTQVHRSSWVGTKQNNLVFVNVIVINKYGTHLFSPEQDKYEIKWWLYIGEWLMDLGPGSHKTCNAVGKWS